MRRKALALLLTNLLAISIADYIRHQRQSGVTRTSYPIMTVGDTDQLRAFFTTSSASATPFPSYSLTRAWSWKDIFGSSSPVPKVVETKSCESAKVFEEIVIDDSVVSSPVLMQKYYLNQLAKEIEFMPNSTLQLVAKLVNDNEELEAAAIFLQQQPMNDQRTMYLLHRGVWSSSTNVDGLPWDHLGPGQWSPPVKLCLLNSWIFGYTVADFSIGNIHVIVTTFFSIEELNIDVDQCDPKYLQILGTSPKCQPMATKCEAVKNAGFRHGGFKCSCLTGFYRPNSSKTYHDDHPVESRPYESCVRCPTRCDAPCELPEQCVVGHNHTLRMFIMPTQIVFMLLVFILMIVVFKNRKCKTVASGMWTIIEIILFGCIILYGTVLVRWVNPYTEMCIIEPWCRATGFVICYGAIILKLYRILIEFRTRKAHRWVVRDKDILKYLLGMFIVVFGYMAAWTANNLNMIHSEDYNILTLSTTESGLSFKVCKAVWWDYVTETCELLILIFGVHLSYASRNAVSQYQERCFLCMAISIEAVTSGCFYVLRFLYWETMDPDMTLLAYFLRSHLTTTLVILLLLVPMWYYEQEFSRSKVSRNYLMQESGRTPFDAFKPQDGATATNSDVEGDLNLSEMNPEDIRAELKRLYTQLEVLKNKTIRFDNPHISKRRGGRKIAHRRFSLQKKGSREKNLRNQAARAYARHEAEAEPSRTPEDSVCSNEGPSVIMNDGPSDVLPSTPRKSLHK